MIHNHDNVWLLRPGVAGFGELPSYLDETDDRPAAEQLGERWQPIGGLFRLDGSALCGDDQTYELLGAIHLRSELVMIFEGAMIVIVQGNRSIEVSRIPFEVSWLELPDNSNTREAATTKAAGSARAHHTQHHSYQPEVFFAHDWHGSGNRFARWDDAKMFVDDLAKNWNPPGFVKGTLIKRVNQPPNARWNRSAKQAEPFDEVDTRSQDGRAA